MTAIHHRARALLDRAADDRFDPRAALRRDHWAHLDARVQAVAGDALLGVLLKSRRKRLGGAPDGNGDRRRQAALARAAERAVGDDFSA